MGINLGMININDIVITPEMLNLIAEIDEFKEIWADVGRSARLFALKKIATIESIGSSTRIEGAKLSNQEVKRLLSRTDLSSFQHCDEQEVMGYAYAYKKIFEYYPDIPLTENMIKQIHTWLLNYSDKDERHRGEYKKIPIQIEAFDLQGRSVDIIFETVSPLETPIKMHELIQWTKHALEKKLLHPLIVIGLFIVIFLAIHPFQDGNGRLSRLLTTLLMMQSNYFYIPYSSLENVIEADKESYYLALQKTQKAWFNHQPDWAPWLLFFLKCLQRQKQHLEVKVPREKMLAEQLSALSKQIMELLHAHGPLSISDIQRLTQANRNTLKKMLLSLVDCNFLSIQRKGKTFLYLLRH